MNQLLDLDPRGLNRLRELGGVGLLREMLELFSVYGAERIAGVTSAQLAMDAAGIRREVHALKSSAGQVGASMIQKLAEDIEHFAQRADVAQCTVLLVDLQTAWGRILPLLRQAIDGAGNDPLPANAPSTPGTEES